ncbi:MAG: glycosyltransferase involved in cell wall biosynthesis [Myxococcota bacterium]|jgi:glycosyltransferase involved in cell wall biosynthesis
MRGGERVLHEIALLYPDADLYTLFHVPGTTTPEIEDRRVIASPLSRLPGVENYYRMLLPLFPWAIRRFDLSTYDLVISCSHAVAKSVRIGPNTAHLSYCLTPMRYIWDQIDAYQGRGIKRALATPITHYLRRFDQRTSRAADVTRFVAISTEVNERIKRHYGRESGLVFPPVDTLGQSERRADTTVTATNYLMVGGFVPYKMETLAIEAFRNSGRSLTIAGDGPSRKQLEATAPANVRFLGRVSDHELQRLYATSKALIYPQQEDFGIIAVEAQAAGCPVIAYEAGGARDTVRAFTASGDGRIRKPTGVTFSEQSPASLNQALDSFEANSDQFDSKCIQDWAADFGVERFRKEFRAEVDGLLEERETIESS